MQKNANTIINSARSRVNASDATYSQLAYLCDSFGPRFSGTPALESALDWVVSTMQAEGFNVIQQPVMVPQWVRGNEWARMSSPRNMTLHFVGLGMSNSTGVPPAPVTAQVLVVTSYDDLVAKAAQAVGKIVLFNVPFTTYGATVQYRSSAAVWAYAVGAVGALIRSVGPYGLQTAHTGSSTTAPIAAGAVSIEDAAMMQRMQDRGQTIVVTMYMEAQQLAGEWRCSSTSTPPDSCHPFTLCRSPLSASLPSKPACTLSLPLLPHPAPADAPSRNIIVEIPGTAKPDEYVVIGGHSDSWDIANGCVDDGGGIMSSLEALRIIKNTSLAPQRTVRAVLWVNEENGARGGAAYASGYAATLNATSIMIETDEGAFQPWALTFRGSDTAFWQLQLLAPLLWDLGSANVTRADSPPGTDIYASCSSDPNFPCGGIEPLDQRATQAANNPCLGYVNGPVPSPKPSIPDSYFWVHHTAADTMERLDAGQLQSVAATLAVWAVTVANLPELLPRTAYAPQPTPGGPGGPGGGPSGGTVAAIVCSLMAAAAGIGGVWYLRRRGYFARLSRGGAGTPQFSSGAYTTSSHYAPIDQARPWGAA